MTSPCTRWPVASEATCDKLRWEVRSRQERDGEAWSEDHELEKVTVFDETNSTIDFAKQRVTNMKFCQVLSKCLECSLSALSAF